MSVHLSKTDGTRGPTLRATQPDGALQLGEWQMRANEIVRRRRARVLTGVAVAATGVLLLAFASPALAGQVGVASGRWSMSKIEQGVGAEPVVHGRMPRTLFDKQIDLGPTPFNYALSPLPDRAADRVGDNTEEYFVDAEAPSIAPDRPFVVKGGETHLEGYSRLRRARLVDF